MHKKKRMHLQITFETIEEKIEEAVNFLKKYEPVLGYWLAFSGGKDSIVARKLCDIAGVKYVAGYSITGIDPPQLLHFIKKYYKNTICGKPDISFYQHIQNRCPPMIVKARWCCDFLKERPNKKIKLKYPIHIIGSRAEESWKRARKPRIDIMSKLGVFEIKPIFHWTEYHILGFIEKFNLPYPNLYDEGFDRIGCVPCPAMFHKNQTKLNMHKKRWPGIFRAFENSVKIWYESKGFKDCKHGSFEKYLAAYYRGFNE